MTTTGAVIVHHANYPTVLRTIDLIVEQGVAPERLVVVDNTEDPSIAESLRQALPSAAKLEIVDNQGYGPAVNIGVACLLEANPLVDYILVSSHETVPAPGAIVALEQALDADPVLGVVGPTLISESQDPASRICWSQGGILTRYLNEPRHVGYLTPLQSMPNGSVVRRAWLDGAFCLYRSAILRNMQFRSDFFLYYEETELHTRMRKQGYAIGWVPSACVEQSSDGVPTQLLGRNLQLFQQLHGTRTQRAFSVPTVIARRAARALIGRSRWNEVGQIARGWISALR
jgi:N-acetylglucosaminyl-diphospho-decaprenol L-rhamnosyltransferase